MAQKHNAWMTRKHELCVAWSTSARVVSKAHFLTSSKVPARDHERWEAEIAQSQVLFHLWLINAAWQAPNPHASQEELIETSFQLRSKKSPSCKRLQWMEPSYQTAKVSLRFMLDKLQFKPTPTIATYCKKLSRMVLISPEKSKLHHISTSITWYLQ